MRTVSHTMWPSTKWNRKSQLKLQLSNYSVHNPAATWVVADSSIFKNLLKAQVSVNWMLFHEVKLP